MFEATESIVVTCPADYFLPEREYIVTVVFKEFLGLPVLIRSASCQQYTIQLGSKKIQLPDCFFPWASNDWLKRKRNLPSIGEPVTALFNGQDFTFRLLFNSRNGSGFRYLDSHTLEFDFDLFGASFFLLSLYEEVVAGERDIHGRILRASLPTEVLRIRDVPLVNIYVEVLWNALRAIQPSLSRRARAFRCIPTHDVDNPFASYYSKGVVFRIIAAALRSFQFDTALSFLKWTMVPRSYPDPYDSYSWLMSRSEENGCTSEFYFITRPHETHLAYSVDDRSIGDTIRNILKRGHVVGLHGSYQSYDDASLLMNEAQVLRERLEGLGASVSSIGGRQHFLRFSPERTWAFQARAGLSFDSTSYFAESPCFRVGCCYEFPVFDLSSRVQLPLRERPLLFMDTTHFVPAYGQGGLKVLNRTAKHMIKTVRAFNGDFTFLWHNCRLVRKRHRRAFEDILLAAR